MKKNLEKKLERKIKNTKEKKWRENLKDIFSKKDHLNLWKKNLEKKSNNIMEKYNGKIFFGKEFWKKKHWKKKIELIILK